MCSTEINRAGMRSLVGRKRERETRKVTVTKNKKQKEKCTRVMPLAQLMRLLDELASNNPEARY
jgi:hypothetical protein